MFKWFKRKKDDERELKTETSEVYESNIRQKKDDKVSLNAKETIAIETTKVYEPIKIDFDSALKIAEKTIRSDRKRTIRGIIDGFR
jgi:hypothetical protein